MSQDAHTRSAPPWRCRWFGHDWRSTASGQPINEFVHSAESGRPAPVKCWRCKVWWDAR